MKFLNFNAALFFIMWAKFYAPEFCAPEFLAPWFSPLEFSALWSSPFKFCEAGFCSLAVTALELCEAPWLKSRSEFSSWEPRWCFIVLWSKSSIRSSLPCLRRTTLSANLDAKFHLRNLDKILLLNYETKFYLAIPPLFLGGFIVAVFKNDLSRIRKAL